MKSIPSAELLKKSVQNWFHSASKEHHPVLHKVIPKLTFLEYYNKMKEGEHLLDTAAIYVLHLHMNKTIGVITSNGIWSTVKTTNTDECDVKFAYCERGIFLPIEKKNTQVSPINKKTIKKTTKDTQGSVTNFIKFKFYTRKHKFVHEQRYTPIRT